MVFYPQLRKLYENFGLNHPGDHWPNSNYGDDRGCYDHDNDLGDFVCAHVKKPLTETGLESKN